MPRMDELIKQRVIEQLLTDDRVDASKISVAVSNGNVTLRGKVLSYFARSSAYEDAERTLGVTGVRNQLVIEYPPIIPLATDSQIEKSIGDRLLANPDIDVKDMQVTVNAKQVTLRGTVDAYWKKIHAEDLVATEPGVESIENHLSVVPTDDRVDKEIAEEIVKSFESRAAVKTDDVNVKVRDGHVTLTGSVSSWSARRTAEEAASNIAGVKHFTNLLSIKGVQAG